METLCTNPADGASIACQAVGGNGPALPSLPGAISSLILIPGTRCDARDPDAPSGPVRPLVGWEEFFADLDADFGTSSRRLVRPAG